MSSTDDVSGDLPQRFVVLHASAPTGFVDPSLSFGADLGRAAGPLVGRSDVAQRSVESLVVRSPAVGFHLSPGRPRLEGTDLYRGGKFPYREAPSLWASLELEH